MRLFFAFLLFVSCAGTSMAGDFVVKIRDVDVKRGGNIVIFIFGEDGFPRSDEKAVTSKIIKADQSEIEVKLSSELDELAIKVFHDEDGNGIVTKNWTGIIPKEGVGVSKQQKISFPNPPKYEKSRLYREEYLKGVTIQLQYM